MAFSNSGNSQSLFTQTTPTRTDQAVIVAPGTPFTMVEPEAQTPCNGERHLDTSSVRKSYAQAVASPPQTLSPYLATTIIIPDGQTQDPEQDTMEVGGEGETGWTTIKSRKRALSFSPTGHSPTDKKNKNKNYSNEGGSSLGSSESAITYLKNYTLPPTPISPLKQQRPNNTKEPEYIWFTLSLPGKAPTAQQTSAIVKGFAQFIGPEKIKIMYQPVDKLGPSFKIPRSEINKARYYKNTHKHNFDLIDFESALRPASGVGRNVNFQESKTQQTQQPTSTGILRNIAKDTNLLYLKNTFNSLSNKVKQIQRIFNKGRPTENIKVTFLTSPPPLTITGDLVYDVYPTLAPYTRCNKCQEHGHKTDKCPKKITICPHCGGHHNHYQCILKHSKTQKQCANCYGNHGAASKNCPAYLEHKLNIDNKNRKIRTEWRIRKLKPRNTESPPSLLDLPPLVPTWAKKETQAHTHTYKPPVEPSKYIEINQLKDILIDLLETPTEVMETTPKAEIVNNILCKHILQPISPNLLTPPQVSPVMVSPSQNIPHYRATSTPLNYTGRNRIQNRRIATPARVTRTKPTAQNALLTNTSDPISID